MILLFCINGTLFCDIFYLDILAMHNHSYSAAARQMYRHNGDKYHQIRDDIDDRMTRLLDTVENKWLGFIKCLLFGKPVDAVFTKKVRSLVGQLASKFVTDATEFVRSGRKVVLTRCLEAKDHLSMEQFHKCLLYCVQGDQRALPKLVEEIEKEFPPKQDDDMIPALNDKLKSLRHPVLLILDREIQCLPWESMR